MTREPTFVVPVDMWLTGLQNCKGQVTTICFLIFSLVCIPQMTGDPNNIAWTCPPPNCLSPLLRVIEGTHSSQCLWGARSHPILICMYHLSQLNWFRRRIISLSHTCCHTLHHIKQISFPQKHCSHRHEYIKQIITKIWINSESWVISNLQSLFLRSSSNIFYQLRLQLSAKLLSPLFPSLLLCPPLPNLWPLVWRTQLWDSI